MARERNRIDDEPGFQKSGGAGMHALSNTKDPDMETSTIAGNPHSASGFRRAIERTARHGNRLSDQVHNFAQKRGPRIIGNSPVRIDAGSIGFRGRGGSFGGRSGRGGGRL